MNLKEYVINRLEPAYFLTFDADEYFGLDGVTTQQTNPFMIIDESGNDNHAMLHDFPVYGKTGYALGRPTLVDKESTLNRSIEFGTNNVVAEKPKSFIAVTHQPEMNLTNGFTLAFYMQRIGQYNGDLLYENIVLKDGLFQFYIKRNKTVSDTVSFKLMTQHPTTGVIQNHIINLPTYGSTSTRIDLLIFRVRIVGNDIILECHINTNLHSTLTIDARTNVLQLDNMATTFINGLPDLPNLWDDRSRNTVKFDQFMYFNRALTDLELANIFKRSWVHLRAIELTNPQQFTPFNDKDVGSTISGEPFNATAYGTFIKNEIAQIRDLITSALFLDINSNVMFGNNLALSTNYTICVAVQSLAYEKAKLFSYVNQTTSSAPFNNPIIQLNVEDGLPKSGKVEFSESGNTPNLHSKDGFSINDGKFHFIMVRRTGQLVELFIDGELHDNHTLVRPPLAGGNIILMNDNNGGEGVNGRVSNFILYNYSLPTHLLRMITLYNTGFFVEGIVTVRGAPIQTDLRYMDALTGELITEDRTRSNGTYRTDLPTEALYNLHAFIKSDNSVRPRIVGAFPPMSFQDQD